MMFVGVIQAVKWVCLSSSEGRMIPLVKRIADTPTADYIDVQLVSSKGTDPVDQGEDDEEELPY